MADVQVTCITKPHPQSPHEHITALGNPAANWKWTREQVIASIDACTEDQISHSALLGRRKIPLFGFAGSIATGSVTFRSIGLAPSLSAWSTRACAGSAPTI